jgi:hypothetical protein
MAKRPPPGRCVHCLALFEELTWDHVFPQAWYPDTTLANLEKWKIPSCLPCNALHAKGEAELLVRIGLCIDPDNPDNAGIVEKALRALTPAAARDERDARARAAHRQEILDQLFKGPDIPYQAVYPGFGPQPGIHDQEAERVAVPISATALRQLTEKIIRGITYIEDSKFIEPPYRVDQYVLDDEGAGPINDILCRFGKVYERAPGITVRRAVVPEDQMTAVYAIEIWRRLTVYAILSREKNEPVT